LKNSIVATKAATLPEETNHEAARMGGNQ